MTTPTNPEEGNIPQCGDVSNLGDYLFQADIEIVTEKFKDASEVSNEVIIMAAIFKELSESTIQHADDCDADGFSGYAEQHRVRALKYEETYQSILKIWSE